MKKKVIVLLMMCMVLSGCAKNTEVTKIDTDDGPTAVYKVSDEAETEDVQTERITDDQAMTAIKNYCHKTNPDLENIEKEGEYPVYWEVISSDENEIVILFRSYTGAQIRYYIDPVLGDTYVTEFVPQITNEEEKTDEEFNIRDYLD